MFDNGGWDFAQGPGEYHSRILEFAVNEETREAELVWEFPGDFDVDPWFTDESIVRSGEMPITSTMVMSWSLPASGAREGYPMSSR